MVTSSGASSYFLRVTFHKAGTIGVIKRNMPESSFLKSGMMRDYALKFSTGKETEEFEFNLEAFSDSGKIYLYAKQCTKPENCGFLNDEIVRNKKLFGDDKVYVEETDSSKKEAQVKFSCGKQNAFSFERVSEDLTVYTCILNVGVFAHQAPAQGMNFQILVSSPNMHVLMAANHFKKFRIRQNAPLLLQFNHHRKQYQVVSSLSFKFDLVYGKAEVFISKTNKTPCDDSAALRALLSPGVPRSLVFKRSMAADKKLKGAYYVCVKGSELSAVNLGVQPISQSFFLSDEDQSRIRVNDLPPNMQILGQFTQKVNMVYFSFTANLDRAAAESIHINLTPIKGTFRIFVSSTGKLPQPEQGHWNVVGTSLEILPTDSSYVEKGKYIVGVQLVSPPQDGATLSKNKWKCMISYTFSDKHVSMRPGVPATGQLSANKSRVYYQLEVPRTVKNITLIKTSLFPNVYVFLTFNNSNGYPSAKQSDFAANPFQSGFFVASESLDKLCKPKEHENHCVAYVAVEAPGGSSEFSVQYVFDNQPFTLLHGMPARLPVIFTDDYPLHFMYQVDHHRDLEFELSSDYQTLEYYMRKAREKKTLAGYTLPTKANRSSWKVHGDDKTNGSIMIPKNETGHRTILLISVYKKSVGFLEHFYGRQSEAQKLFFINNGLLEISKNDKVLQRGVPVSKKVTRGEWKYFRIHHPSNAGNLVLSAEVDNGAVEVFISRGFDSLPSEGNFLIKRADSSSELMTVDQVAVGPGASVAGPYFVGVRGVSFESQVQLIYRTGDLQVYSLKDGTPTKLLLHNGERNFIEFVSDRREQDIVINFKSRTASVFAYATAKQIDQKSELPTPDNFIWSANILNEGGYSKLVIPKNSTGFCTMCNIIVLVEVSTTDRITFVASKKGPGSLIRLVEGKSYVGKLGKGEFETFALVVPFNETYLSIDLRIQTGNLTFSYGMRPTFEDPRSHFSIKEKTQDEFFNINFGRVSTYFRKIFKTQILRFLKVQSEAENSEYTLTVVSDRMLTELNSFTPKQSLLAAGGTHFYYMHSYGLEAVDLSFHLRNIIGVEKPDFEDYVSVLPKMIKLYQANDFAQVEQRTYDYELETRTDLYRHELRVTGTASSKEGFVVVVVKNTLSKPMSFSLESNRFGTKRLTATHETVDFIPDYQKKYLFIDNEVGGKIAKFRIDQCLGTISARFAHTKGTTKTNLTSFNRESLEYETLFNSQVSNTFIRTQDKKTIQIEIVRETSQVNSRIHGQDTTRRYDPSIPSIYAINFELQDSVLGSDDGANPTSFVVGDTTNYGEVEIFTDAEQSIKFKGLTFHEDFLKLHTDTYVFINYTLFMSKDKDMMTFMKYCSGYRIDQAEAALKTTNHYSFSVQEYYALNLSTTRAGTPIHSIQPHSMTFGGIYYGVIVAELRFWKIRVTFPHLVQQHLPQSEDPESLLQRIRVRACRLLDRAALLIHVPRSRGGRPADLRHVQEEDLREAQKVQVREQPDERVQRRRSRQHVDT